MPARKIHDKKAAESKGSLSGHTVGSGAQTLNQPGVLPYKARKPSKSLILWTSCITFAVVAVILSFDTTSARFGGVKRWLTDLTWEAQQGEGIEDELHVYGVANGVFPRGCKWRDVQTLGHEKAFWAEEVYEFWDETTSSWSRQEPQDCKLKGIKDPPSHVWQGGRPHSQVWCDPYSCLYQNLWYNEGKWMLLVGDGSPEPDWWSLTRNVDLSVKHVISTTEFASSVNYTFIPGSTLVLDFPYFHHPTAIGHWGEVMSPLFSIFKNETDFKLPPDQFVLLHLKRVHLMEWARAVMAAALGLQRGEPLPRIILQAEGNDVEIQIGGTSYYGRSEDSQSFAEQPLEGIESNEWFCFEHALVVNDLPSGGVHSFLHQEDARSFRTLMYANHGLPSPSLRIPPRQILYQRKRANRRVVNEAALVDLLRSYGEVRIVEFNASTPLDEQLRIISGTGVFVSTHTSNLANAQFLQPGSAVFEIIQRNWFWADMDLTFKMQTMAMGDIHHYAWRAVHRNQTVYLRKQEEERFGNWTAEMCDGGECVEAHTNVDVVVDLEEFRGLLDSRLPLVFKGASVEEAEIEWPGRGFNISSPFQATS